MSLLLRCFCFFITLSMSFTAMAEVHFSSVAFGFNEVFIKVVEDFEALTDEWLEDFAVDDSYDHGFLALLGVNECDTDKLGMEFKKSTEADGTDVNQIIFYCGGEIETLQLRRRGDGLKPLSKSQMLSLNIGNIEELKFLELRTSWNEQRLVYEDSPHGKELRSWSNTHDFPTHFIMREYGAGSNSKVRDYIFNWEGHGSSQLFVKITWDPADQAFYEERFYLGADTYYDQNKKDFSTEFQGNFISSIKQFHSIKPSPMNGNSNFPGKQQR